VELTVTLLVGAVWFCLAAIGALVLLLLPPFHLDAAGEMEDLAGDGECRVNWCWGLLLLRATPDDGLELFILGRRAHSFDRDAAKKSEDETKTKERETEYVCSVPAQTHAPENEIYYYYYR
jgi:hypothetical protein